MDFSLDDAESEFLKAVLSGIEASPGLRELEGSAAHLKSDETDEPCSLAPNPQASGAAAGFHEAPGALTAPGPEQSQRRDSPPPQHTTPVLLGPGEDHQDALPGSATLTTVLMPAADDQQQQLAHASPQRPPPPPPPPMTPQPQRTQTRSLPAVVTQPCPGALSPVYTAAPGRPPTAARPPPGPTSTPIGAVLQRHPHLTTPLPAPPASTATSTPGPSAGSSSPFTRLPASHSTGAISEVSVATFASAPSTGSSSPSPSASSRRFSGSALPTGGGPAPAAAAAAAAAATPAAAAATPPSLSSSRRAQGLLQRIQSLEAQLTELLLAGEEEDDGEGEGGDYAAGPVASGSLGAAAAAGALRPTGSTSHPYLYQPHSRQQQHQRQHSPSQAHIGRHSTTSNAGATTFPASTHAQQQQLLQHPQQQVFWVAEQLCRDYNSSGVALMEAGLDEAAREQLAKALLLAGPGGPLDGSPDKQREMQIVAHNNLACYYRKFRQPALALEHLQHAARLETEAAAAAAVTGTAARQNEGANWGGSDNEGVDAQGADATGPGDGGGGGAVAAGGAGGQVGGGPTAATLLNLAAVSSSLGQHMQALSYAARAVRAAAGELQVPLAPLESALLQGLPQGALWEVLPQLRRAGSGATTQLAMAYYNRAVEQEHLHQWHAALESYRLAVDVCGRFVGRGDELTLTMQQSAEAFKVRFRKLERQGKVRAAARPANPGGLGGAGSCPPALATSPLPGSAAAATAAARAGGGCAAALPRPHPHLRPLLRCATTTAVVTTTTSVAAAAAAAALAGLPARGSRTAPLPAIAPGRPFSTPSGGAGGGDFGRAGTDTAVSVTAACSPTDPRVTTVSALAPPRRALSAGRAPPPPPRAPSGRGSASHVPPCPDPTAAAAEPARRGGASHVLPAAPSYAAVAAAAADSPRRDSASQVPAVSHSPAATPAAALLGRESARTHRRAGWSSPLPPKPPPEASGVGHNGVGSSGGGISGSGSDPEPGAPRRGPGGPGVAAFGAKRVGQDPTTPRMPTSRWTSGGDTTSTSGGGVAAVESCPSGRRSAGHIPAAESPLPPTPMAPALAIAGVAAAAVPAAAAAAGTWPSVAVMAASTAKAGPSESGSAAVRRSWREQRSDLSEEGSLAAVAAAAVAAAAELERICAAGEEWQGLERREAGVGLAQVGGATLGEGPGKARGPHFVSTSLPSSAKPTPRPAQKPVNGMGGGSARVGESWCRLGGGGSTVRLGSGPVAGAAGGMLVPKRDGVAV